MASADFPGHFLPGISPDKSVLLPGTTAAFTSASEPLGFAVLCQLATSRRPSMRFLSVGPPVSHSLPPHGRLPFRSWLLVVVSHVSMSGSPNRTSRRLSPAQAESAVGLPFPAPQLVSLGAAGGVPQVALMELVGHGSPAMTRLCIHAGEDQIPMAIAVLPAYNLA